MPSMRHSYTVTVPEDPPATAFPFLKPDLRRKTSAVSGSVLVSTFVGLLINQAKVRQALTHWHGKGSMLIRGLPSAGPSSDCFTTSTLDFSGKPIVVDASHSVGAVIISPGWSALTYLFAQVSSEIGFLNRESRLLACSTEVSYVLHQTNESVLSLPFITVSICPLKLRI